MNEQRRVMRVLLPDPVVGFAGQERVYVLDASLRGVRISHLSLFPRRADLLIHFEWDGREIDVVGSVRWTKLHRIGNVASAKALYQSGVEITSLREDTVATLRGLVEYQVERALDEQKANAKGIPPIAAQSVQTGQSSTYARHELVNGVWRKIVTTDSGQPMAGFTVSSAEIRDQIEILRSAYQIADPEMKRIIQMIAGLTLSQAERIPMRRYTP